MDIPCTSQILKCTHLSSSKEQHSSAVDERQEGERREEGRGEEKAEEYQYMNEFTDNDFQTTGV